MPSERAASTLTWRSSMKTSRFSGRRDAGGGEPVDRRIGFGQALGAGDHDVGEQAQEVEARGHMGPVELVGEVGERDLPHAGRVQGAQQVHRAGHLAGEGEPEVLAVGTAVRQPPRMVALEDGEGVVPARAGIAGVVPDAKSNSARKRRASTSPTPAVTAATGDHRTRTSPRSHTTPDRRSGRGRGRGPGGPAERGGSGPPLLRGHEVRACARRCRSASDGRSSGPCPG